MSGGFDLPGLFGISAGSATSNSDYGVKWSNFCQANYATAMSNSDLSTYFSTANQSVLHSFDNCVNVTSEQFIRYVQPQEDGKTFAIVFDNKSGGDASFTIESITLTISGGGSMRVQDDCDFRHPFPWGTRPLHSISIVCRKRPEEAVVVNATTSAGNIVPVTVPAVPAPGPGIADRVAAIEGVVGTLSGNTQALTQNIQSLSQKVSTNETNIVITKNRITSLATGDDTQIEPGGNGGTKTCPKGSFLVAVHSQIDDGGPHGIASWLYAVCRKVE
jgi:hypothetical protein